MKVLLDTHVFLWWITDSHRLSSRAQEIISNGNNEIFISAASGWEIAIKSKLGKLQVSGELESYIPEQININGFLILPVQMYHALHIYNLPSHHSDPFDRLIVSQGILENLPVLSSDKQISLYDVKVIW